MPNQPKKMKTLDANELQPRGHYVKAKLGTGYKTKKGKLNKKKSLR